MVYVVWAAVWVTWNVFIICFYLEVGGLSRDSGLLTFNLSRHRSWWQEHGPGCLHEGASPAGLRPLHGQALVSSTGCSLEPGHVEALHSSLQILVALLGFVYSCYVVSMLMEEEDSCLSRAGTVQSLGGLCTMDSRLSSWAAVHWHQTCPRD
ncbi:sodium/potassium-transporting ATPase subunit beta-1-interacting protein 4 isoform X4 [Cavia porcellus]